ncbi:hypothetical protein BDV12DRAFT_181815, partial [Aspergillus spectabilis]
LPLQDRSSIWQTIHHLPKPKNNEANPLGSSTAQPIYLNSESKVDPCRLKN